MGAVNSAEDRNGAASKPFASRMDPAAGRVLSAENESVEVMERMLQKCMDSTGSRRALKKRMSSAKKQATFVKKDVPLKVIYTGTPFSASERVKVISKELMDDDFEDWIEVEIVTQKVSFDLPKEKDEEEEKEEKSEE